MAPERLPAPSVPDAIAAALKVLPDAPGVYLFSDSAGKIIYVGKATHLTQRIRLRDDRSYPYIRVTADPYPRVERTRRLVRDGSRYFGPYTTPGSVNAAMEAIKRLFQFRTCEIAIKPMERALERPCLLYDLKRCQGPCLGNIPVADYQREIDGVQLFLGGRSRAAITMLQARMESAAEREAFEDAARIRDAVLSLETTFDEQKVPTSGRADEDVLGIARHGRHVAIACFQIRDSALVGRDVHRVEAGDSGDAELLAGFAASYYARAGEIPPSIATATELSDPEILEFLSARREGRVEMRVPQRGDRARIVRLAERNAEEWLIRREAEEDADRERADAALSALSVALHLDASPARIECVDVSTIQGAFTVSSLTVAQEGQLAPKEYRRFRIKGVTGQDDFAAHAEALTRRFARSVADGTQRSGEAESRAWSLPDLLVIDGGRGQVSAAAAVLDAAGLTIPLVGLAKEREELWMRDASAPILLPATDPGLRLLQRLRDEAHRFAIGYHRTLRSRAATASRLDGIRGLGPTKRKALLRRFGSAAGIAAAPVEALTEVPGVDQALAARILTALGADRG